MKTIFERTVSLTILVALLASAIIPGAFAVDTAELPTNSTSVFCEGNELQTPPAPTELPYAPTEDEYSTSFFSPTRKSDADILLSTEQLIKEALLTGEKSVDLSSYEIYPDDINLGYLAYFSPYIGSEIGITCFHYSGSYYSSIEITTDMSTEELKHHVAEVDMKIAEISDLLKNASSDHEKALIVHDYLVFTGEYDYDNYLNGSVSNDSFRSYGLLMNNTGVCQAYAYSFMYFMAREGIECYVTSSSAMNHAWNIVNIDGEYYHVDVTWDDPVYDRLGKVSHDHFLTSDAAISSYRGNSTKYHHGWDRTDLVCDSKKYDNAGWTNVVSQVISYKGYTYYIKGNDVYKYNNSNGKETSIASLGEWRVWGSNRGYWNGSYSGLFLYDGELYYNTSTQIHKINLDTLSDKTAYTPDTSEGYVYGCALVGNTFKYAINQNPNNKSSVFSFDFSNISSWKKVTLDKHFMIMAKEDTYRLTAKGITDGLVWTSDNDYVASVDSNGMVTAKDIGITDITVHAPNGSVATCVILVKSAHLFGNSTVTAKPTCTKPGEESRSCIFCGKVEVTEIEALGHDTVSHEAKAPSCTASGWDAYETCTKCDHTTYKELPVTDHDFGEWITVTEPTNEKDGLCERYCDNCDAFESKNIPSLGHKHSHTETVIKPTCKTEGYTMFLCKCGDTYKTDFKEELGHDFSKDWTTDIEATENNTGEKSHHCTRCEARSNVTILPIMINSSKVFSDIPESEWFKTSVDFVVSNGLMKGVGPDTFDPKGTMTRAMVVTVLYRMEGEPAVSKSAPFTDLKEDWYKNPVAWAYENEIVKGTGATTFSPNGEITREQLATILYRYSEYKKYSVTASEDIGSFPDASDTDSWATGALMWAFGEGLITGSNEGGITYLKPLGDATRAQVATILTRFCKKH